MDLKEIGWEGVEWIDLAQNRAQRRAVVNTVINPRVPLHAENFVICKETISLLRTVPWIQLQSNVGVAPGQGIVSHAGLHHRHSSCFCNEQIRSVNVLLLNPETARLKKVTLFPYDPLSALLHLVLPYNIFPSHFHGGFKSQWSLLGRTALWVRNWVPAFILTVLAWLTLWKWKLKRIFTFVV
jgi:hypothetical protein